MEVMVGRTSIWVIKFASFDCVCVCARMCVLRILCVCVCVCVRMCVLRIVSTDKTFVVYKNFFVCVHVSESGVWQTTATLGCLSASLKVVFH